MKDLLVALPDGGPPRAGIENRLRELIRSGAIRAGAPLPSTRGLASDLGVARSTVVAAYEQLAAEGYLRTSQGKPTVVAEVGSASRPEVDRNPFGDPPKYDFRAGEPEAGSFPRREWLRSTRRVLATATDDVFGYADPRGRLELREALADYLARARMVNVDAAAVRVYASFSSTLGFLGQLAVRRNIERIAVEQPMLPFHRSILQSAGVDVVPIKVDEDGLSADLLAEHKVGAVMVTPANQHPLGVTMSSQRRQALVQWARTTNGFIIEDDYDGEFRYDRRPILSLIHI